MLTRVRHCIQNGEEIEMRTGNQLTNASRAFSFRVLGVPSIAYTRGGRKMAVCRTRGQHRLEIHEESKKEEGSSRYANALDHIAGSCAVEVT